MKIICITPIKHLEGAYEKLDSMCNLKYLPDINKDELKKILFEESFTYLFTNPNKQNFILDKEVLEDSNIKVINTCSTGLNHIDTNYCKENNIDIWSLKTDYDLINNLPSTSELAFGLMMSLLRNIPKSFHSVKDGNWDYEPYVGHQIKGKTIGVIGYGRLGKIMCQLFEGWGVKVLVYDPYIWYPLSHPLRKDFLKVDRGELLKKSDVVFLHTHVTDDTRDMVDEEFISHMKEGSYLINTARGELVDEDAIIDSIKAGHLKGYGTDVIKDEFGDIQNSKLVEFSINSNNNVVITPHIGGMTIEGQTKAYHWAINKFKNCVMIKKEMEYNKFLDKEHGVLKIKNISMFINTLKKATKNKHRSQYGETGVLVELFDNFIKQKPKFCVEFGSGTVSSRTGTANIRHLYDKYKSECLYYEIDESKIKKSQPEYRDQITIEKITASNVNSIFAKYRVPYDLDVVVIDVDGQDYWIWKNLQYNPKIVLIEFNPSLLPYELKVMHKDDKHYDWRNGKCSYYGASISSMKNLGMKKGYSLIYSTPRNLIFVQKKFIEVDIDESFLHTESSSDFNRTYIEEPKWVEI